MNLLALRTELRVLTEEAVYKARLQGLTWRQIAAALGVKQQTAWSRFWAVAVDTGRAHYDKVQCEREREEARKVWPSTFRPEPPFRVEEFKGYLIRPGGVGGNHATDLHVVDARGRTCRVFDRYTHKHATARRKHAERYRDELTETFA